ncbi:MAG: hypothetical protein IJA56_04640 [Clostridia bacterium]|nr:hypothetical protein [Clostridia bacterium]
MKKKAVKLLSILLAAALLIGASVGGTLAWLSAKSETVTNTFTVGNIGISLAETTGSEYKMVPGSDIAKDPKITVDAKSEACYLFVKIGEQERDNANITTGTADPAKTYITYKVATGWEELESGVYYRKVDYSDAAQYFTVLAGKDGVDAKGKSLQEGFLHIENTVTKDMLKAENDAAADDELELSFTAYAVQQAGFENNAAGAWVEAKKLG